MDDTTLFLAITTDDGNTFVTEANSNDQWSTFTKVAPLSGNSLQVTSWHSVVATIDDSSPSDLRLSDGFDPARDVATGLGLASFDKGSSHFGDEGSHVARYILGAGGPTSSAWSFSLPLYQIDPVTGLSRQIGELTDPAFRMRPGALDPTDPPVALSLAQVSGSPGALVIQLCLATASGGLYYLALSQATGGSFVDVKAAAGDPGNVSSVSAAIGDAGLHVCVVGEVMEGGMTRHPILHTVLNPAGTWARWGNVNQAGRSNADFAQVSVAHFAVDFTDGQTRGQTLYLVGTTATGGDLLFTKRGDPNSNRNGEISIDPVWQPFVSVGSKTGHLPGPVTSAEVSARSFTVAA